MNKELKRIIGGIDVINDSIIIGGAEVIVGENVQWMTRNKLLMFENEIKNDINIRRLIKIVGVKLPILTTDNVYYDTEPLPKISNDELNNIMHKKTLTALKKRMNTEVDIVIENLIIEYELRDPFYMVIHSIIRCLAYINKINNPNSYKIKVNAAIASKLAFRESQYFKFSTSSNINNTKDLVIYMLSLVEKKDNGDKNFTCPVLKQIQYPVFDRTEYDSKNRIEITKLAENNSIKDHVFSILMMENILVKYLDKIERYYISCAKNMTLILDALHKYFRIDIIL